MVTSHSVRSNTLLGRWSQVPDAEQVVNGTNEPAFERHFGIDSDLSPERVQVATQTSPPVEARLRRADSGAGGRAAGAGGEPTEVDELMDVLDGVRATEILV